MVEKTGKGAESERRGRSARVRGGDYPKNALARQEVSRACARGGFLLYFAASAPFPAEGPRHGAAAPPQPARNHMKHILPAFAVHLGHFRKFRIRQSEI